MKKILASTLVLAFLSTISFAETPTTKQDIETPSIVVLGPVSVTVEPTDIRTEENEYDVNFGLTHKKEFVSWDIKVNKTLQQFQNTNNVSAGISWKF